VIQVPEFLLHTCHLSVDLQFSVTDRAKLTWKYPIFPSGNGGLTSAVVNTVVFTAIATEFGNTND